jgi:hypothetical protein
MLFLLKKQFGLIENNQLFKILVKVSIVSAKYLLNMLVFLLAAKSYSANSQDESWNQTILYLENFFKDPNNLHAATGYPNDCSAALAHLDSEAKTDPVLRVVDDTMCSDSGYMSRCDTESLDESSFCFHSSNQSLTRLSGSLRGAASSLSSSSSCKTSSLASFRELNMAQFKLQSNLANTKINRHKMLIKRLRSYYKNNLIKVN